MKTFSTVNETCPDMMASCSFPENTKNNDLYLVRRRDLAKTNLITSASYLDTNSRVKCSMHSSPNIVTAHRVYPYTFIVLVVAKVKSVTSYAMCILGVNAEAIGSRIRVKSKGTQDCFTMDVKHCTCIFKQKANVFQRIVHLQKPRGYMDIEEKGATMTSESEESFQGAGCGYPGRVSQQ